MDSNEFTTPAGFWPIADRDAFRQMATTPLDAIEREIHQLLDDEEQKATALRAEKLAELTQEIPTLLFGAAIFEAWSKAHRGDLYVPPRRGRHHRVQRRSLVVLAVGVAAFLVGLAFRGRDPR